MTRSGWTTAAAALLAAAVFAPSPAGAAGEWIRLRTPRLSIVSSAGEGPTTRLAERLEQFVDAFSSLVDLGADPDVPVTVMVFADEAAFAPFRPRQNGQTLNLSGYFQRADDEHLIALSLETSGDEHPYRVVFHEYAHALTARAAGLWPLWLQEGLAEFYSTFEAARERVALGQPVREHARLLRTQPLMPLRRLFEIGGRVPTSAEHQQGIFYAESWALVHYLLAGDGGRRRPAFAGYIDALAAEVPPDRAFREAFGDVEHEREEALRRYIAEGRYAGVNLAIERPPAAVRPSIRSLPAAEAEVFQGSLLMRVGRGGEADAHFARARALDPRAPRLEESLGFLALSRARYEDALAHLRTAIEHDPSNPLAHYYYAEALRRRVMEQGRALPAAVARAMAEPLRTVIALQPSFARAHYLLGYAHFVAGEHLPEGIRRLETAIRLAPPHRGAMLTLASIQLKMRNYVAAQATARAIVGAPDASEAIKAEARRLLTVVDQNLGR